MGYEVVRYRPELKPGTLDLLAHAWSTDRARNAATFAWKFEQNPYLGQPLLHLVLHGGQVVALHGADWRRGPGDARLPALGAGDFVIHPAHRGRHLFGRIATAAAVDARGLGYRYLLNLSAGPATYLQSLRAGWRDLGHLETLRCASLTARIARLGYDAVAARPAIRALARFAQGKAVLRRSLGMVTAERRFARLEARLGVESARAGQPLTVGGEARPEAMAALVARTHGDARIHHARDVAFFRWRFRNPLSRYRFVFGGAEALTGFAVLETPDDPLRDRVRVVLCAAEDATVRRHLLRAVVEAGRFNDLRLWSNGLAPDERAWLERMGCGTVAQPASVSHRRALLAWDLEGGGRGGDALPAIDGWGLSMIDSDKC